MRNTEKRGLVWFRNDLRVNDQKSLSAATQECSNVFGVVCIDPSLFKLTPWGFKKTEHFRAQFLIETLIQLKEELHRLNISLIVEYRDPIVGVVHWANELKCTDLYFQNEWTQEEFNVEQCITSELYEKLRFHKHFDQFLFHPDDLPFSLNQLPSIFTEFRKKCENNVSVRNCIKDVQPMNQSNLLKEDLPVPTLFDLGFSRRTIHPQTAFPFSGGTSSAIKRMEAYFWTTKKLSYYKQTRNGLMGKDYSSKFSPWLANGSLSARQIYWEVRRYEKEVEKNDSTYWLIFELIWRDYFKYISMLHGNSIFFLGGILSKNYTWNTDLQLFQNWCNGNTKEPFVNAAMIELQKTGWMSNRGRQNTASYFAKNMQMDWRMGAAYFEAYLLDYDVHSNYGNWMYVAGVGNDPRDRVFNVRLQAERYDPQGKFQRLWNQNELFE